MELYDEEYLNRKQKKSKLPMILGIIIVFLIIITFVILYLIIYLRGTVTKISLDGVSTNELGDIFYIDESSGNLYIPIRKIAKYFDYEDYSGDYKYKSEDSSKCYVKNEYETAMFTVNTNTLIKVRDNSDYEYVNIDENVFEKDNELYTTIDGIEKAFNVQFNYNQEKKQISIYTMDYLVTYYATALKIENYSTEFIDKKAIFQGMIIISNTSGQYGVMNVSTSEYILEPKYASISYLPNTGDFLVNSNNKYGIMSKDATTKVKIVYDQIKIMDNKNGLYLIKQDNLYGIIDTKGNTILQPQYQQIGLNINDFSQNAIESEYIILDKLIPIKSNGLWGFFDLKGNKVTEFQYTDIGCKNTKLTNTYPVLVIPSYNIVVVKKGDYYNLMTLSGREIINVYIVDSVYLTINVSTGETKYFMTYNGKTENVEEMLQKTGE